MFSAWLAAAGRFPLLTATEEIELARKIERGAQPDATPREQRIAKRAKDRMVECNLRLVVAVAKRYRSRATANHDSCDMLQMGVLGLIRAVEKFDYTRGYKFSTYAHAWINQAIGRGVVDSSRNIRLPMHVAEKLTAIRKNRALLTTELGREPTLDELAERVGIECTKMRELLRAADDAVSLDAMIHHNDGETTLVDMIGACDEEIDDRVELFAEALEQLPPDAREILERKYAGEAFAAIGRDRGVSRERVRQVASNAIDKVREIVAAA